MVGGVIFFQLPTIAYLLLPANKGRMNVIPRQAATEHRKSRTIAPKTPSMTHMPRLPFSTAEWVGGIFE